MEGIGLDNMLGAEEVSRLLSNPIQPLETPEPATPEGEAAKSEEQPSAEVPLGLQPGASESVGDEEEPSEERRGAPASNNGGTPPQKNLFSSIAQALKDEGVFPDLSDDTIESTLDAAGLRKLFDDEVGKSLDERQKQIESLLKGGAAPAEIQQYQRALSTSQFLESRETSETLAKEGEDGETLRKQVMFQDYLNRGFREEKAKKLVEKSFSDGTDIEDAQEAYESCKAFYKNQVEEYQKAVAARQKQQQAEEEKQFNTLKKRILDTESFYGDLKVDRAIRQKAYDMITKPVHKDENGNYLTALQQYQREHPLEFMENVAMLYALTDEFKSVDRMTKSKVRAGLKKGFADLENVLNNSHRNSDGTLNLANTAPDESERERWTLAI